MKTHVFILVHPFYHFNLSIGSENMKKARCFHDRWNEIKMKRIHMNLFSNSRRALNSRQNPNKHNTPLL